MATSVWTRSWQADAPAADIGRCGGGSAQVAQVAPASHGMRARGEGCSSSEPQASESTPASLAPRAAASRGGPPSSLCRTGPPLDLRRRPAVDGDGSFARWCLGRLHLSCGRKRERDLDAEVARNPRARLLRVVIERRCGRQPIVRAGCGCVPDLGERRTPCRTSRVRRDLTPHRGQRARVNSLDVH